MGPTVRGASGVIKFFCQFRGRPLTGWCSADIMRFISCLRWQDCFQRSLVASALGRNLSQFLKSRTWPRLGLLSFFLFVPPERGLYFHLSLDTVSRDDPEGSRPVTSLISYLVNWLQGVSDLMCLLSPSSSCGDRDSFARRNSCNLSNLSPSSSWHDPENVSLIWKFSHS